MNYVEHIARAGDRWDSLAWRYYGDAAAFDRILAANPHIPFSDAPEPGVRVMIPVVDVEPVAPADTLPPWKRP